MTQHRNRVVCTFEQSSPRISAHETHEWIFEELRLPEHNVTAIQFDVLKRQVYIKLSDSECMHTLIRDTNGQAVFKHQSGELPHVTIEIASLGSKRLRVVNLPPEVENDNLRDTLAPYSRHLK
jgi:hypothetical protein